MLEALISISNNLLRWPLYVLGGSLNQRLQIGGNTWHLSHIGIHQQLMLRCKVRLLGLVLVSRLLAESLGHVYIVDRDIVDELIKVHGLLDDS